MNCIIIDQDVSAGRVLAEHIARAEGMELRALCDSLQLAKAAIEIADTIFMDPDMPGLDPVSFLDSLAGGQQLIITSASGRHALKAFEWGAVDYLLKPFSPERFTKVSERLKKLQALAPEPHCFVYPDYFFVKSDSRFERINRDEILYIESLQNYITIQTETKKVITYSSLKSIESYLPERDFLRIQRSFLVSISKIERLDSEDVVVGKTSIPISRSIRERVFKRVLNNRLYKFQA